VRSSYENGWPRRMRSRISSFSAADIASRPYLASVSRSDGTYRLPLSSFWVLVRSISSAYRSRMVGGSSHPQARKYDHSAGALKAT